MTKAKLPEQIPLPEVPQHTEEVVFGALDFPVGFEQDRLLVNLRTFDRVRRIAGLDTVSVVAHEGESEPADVEVDGVDDQGTAILGLASKRRKKPLSIGNLKYPPESSPLVGRPRVTISVDNTELETRIEEKPEKYKKGAFDPAARAKFLNRAIKAGLTDANFNANLNKYEWLVSGGVYGINTALVEVGYYPFAMIPMTGLISNLFNAGREALSGDKSPDEALKAFKNYRHSLFYGITPDRYIGAQTLLATRKLIKARS